uniref:VWFA domain-containing protein n=1 Tax=Sphenodon punctatus TaxID=8508 RepID=A0A8D0H418_SPHPU
MGSAARAKLFLGATAFLHLIECSGAFNIDTETPALFQGDPTAWFGYRVLQAKSNGSTWLVVSAPLWENRTGSLYRCAYNTETCERLPLGQIPPISLGLSLAADESTDSRIIACGPTYEHRCGENTFLNGICYLFSSLDLGNISPQEIRPAYQECVTGVDAVILYDDSQSISKQNFQTMKRFILDLIGAAPPEGDVRFTVAHFSTETYVVFSFNKYHQAGNRVPYDAIFLHLEGETHTPSAIQFVADKVFTPENGARPQAKRLLVVLTDGLSNDKKTNFRKANEAADQKRIVRFAVGVGKVFADQTKRAWQELNTIASRPENVFDVDSFQALESLRAQLQEKIFAIEGTSQASNASSFELELSQGGFSAVLPPVSAVRIPCPLPSHP